MSLRESMRASFEDALGDDLRARVRRADAHALALEVGECADAGALQRHHLHVAAVDLGHAASGTGSSNASRPSTASSAVSPSVSAMSALPSRSRIRFSTAPVLPWSARPGSPSRCSEMTLA